MNFCNIYRLDDLGFAITNILNDICREMSLYIYSPELAIFEHKKANFGSHISAMLCYLYIHNNYLFLQVSTFFIDAFQKVYHSLTGSGLDKKVYVIIAMFEMKESSLKTGDMMVIQF